MLRALQNLTVRIVLAALVATTWVSMVSAQESVIRLEGRAKGPEGTAFPMSAFVIHPGGEPLTYRWDFGDGSQVVTGEGLSSVAHRYRRDDDYTVTLAVTGGDGREITASREVTVTNARPVIRELASRPDIELADAYQFTAEATDWSSDELTYTWDFGDGSPPQSGVDLTRVSHAYSDVGQFTVTLTVEDEDGGARDRTLEIYTGPSRWSATLSGDLSGELEGDVMPFRGLWASPVSNGRCRFMLTLWDDDAQVYLMIIVDPKTLSRGFTYTSGSNGGVTLIATNHSQEYFMQWKQTHANPLGLGGMVNLSDVMAMVPGDQGDKEDARAQLERNTVGRLGINPFQQESPGSPDRQTEPTPSGGGVLAPDADPQYSFRSNGGTMSCRINPDHWIECELDMTLENTDDDEEFPRSVALEGSFFINIPNAMTDGLYRARACDEGEAFRVRDAEPEPEDRYAGFETTTVRRQRSRSPRQHQGRPSPGRSLSHGGRGTRRTTP